MIDFGLSLMCASTLGVTLHAIHTGSELDRAIAAIFFGVTVFAWRAVS